MELSAQLPRYQATVEHIQRWLPLIIDRLAIEDTLANRAIYPDTVPDSFRELMIEQSRKIEAVRSDMAEIPKTWHEGILTVDKSLSFSATDGVDLLWLALNSYEPTGVVTVYDEQRREVGITISLAGVAQKLVVTIDQGTTEVLRASIPGSDVFLLPPQSPGFSRMLRADDPMLAEGVTVPAHLPVVIDTRARPLADLLGKLEARVCISRWRRHLGLATRER